MASRRRHSGHRNKLYEESSAWGTFVVLGFIVVAVIGLVMFFVWSQME